MKNTFKTFAPILFLGLLSFNQVSAQKKTEVPKKYEYKKGFRLGLGFDAGLPTDGDYEAALGGNVRLQYDLSKKTSLIATTGYTHMFQQGDDAGFIPAKLGFKAFLGNQFYAQGEAGAAFGVNGALDNSLLLSPAFGFANKYIDVSLKYENYTDYKTDQIGIRIAYGFSLK